MMWKKVGIFHSADKSDLSSFKSREHGTPISRNQSGLRRNPQLSAMIVEEFQGLISGKTTVKHSRSKSMNSRKLAVAIEDPQISLMTQIHINFHSQQKKSRQLSPHFKNSQETKENIHLKKLNETSKMIKEARMDQMELKYYVQEEIKTLNNLFENTLRVFNQQKSKKVELVLEEVKGFRSKMALVQEERVRILKEHNLTFDSLL